ncbi:MAG: Plug domain-containing protein [Saprospiraceae bacterium]|nr:Plug domain-containing protein [Saprospiraceae bacterium]
MQIRLLWVEDNFVVRLVWKKLTVTYQYKGKVHNRALPIAQTDQNIPSVKLVFSVNGDTFSVVKKPTVLYVCRAKFSTGIFGIFGEKMEETWREINEDAVWNEPRNNAKKGKKKKNTTARTKADRKKNYQFTEEKDALTTQRESANAVVVIDKKDFEKSRLSYSKRYTEGASPGKRFGTDDDEETPDRRGIGTGYTQILIDGNRVPGGADNRSVRVDNIPAAMIERIVIIRNSDGTTDAQVNRVGHPNIIFD